MSPHIREQTLYYFNELNDDAKEKARQWWREHGLDYEWWDCSYEDFVACAKTLGIEISSKPTTRMDGKPGLGSTNIYFSGFCSQGDGACFEGWYSYQKGWRKLLKAYAPIDAELMRIGEALQDTQKRLRYEGTATIAQSGRYSHSGCMIIEVGTGEVHEYPDGPEEDIKQALRDFADWMYKRLEGEHDYLNGDESVDEGIVANEYEFFKNGGRA